MRWKRVFGVVTITALLLIGGCIVIDRMLDPFDDRSFDPAMWAVAKPQDRAPMARDAIRHLPAGMTKAQVRELLGEGQPVHRDERGPVDVFGNPLKHPETWTYHLGGWSGLDWYSFDAAYLYVHFGADGCVAGAEITGG